MVLSVMGKVESLILGKCLVGHVIPAECAVPREVVSIRYRSHGQCEKGATVACRKHVRAKGLTTRWEVLRRS